MKILQAIFEVIFFICLVCIIICVASLFVALCVNAESNVINTIIIILFSILCLDLVLAYMIDIVYKKLVRNIQNEKWEKAKIAFENEHIYEVFAKNPDQVIKDSDISFYAKRKEDGSFSCWYSLNGQMNYANIEELRKYFNITPDD